ncbi:hypothetical protein E1B28_010315 [Marasmius oreades]|uniref:MACPF domain-containing protein n=1 Tax=Marasmius oreades TaxID=181124 RepID=A0A9P7URM9_9AGAR|nr:uncharacterized protein E1B28_010315 [Marasmius oreades]KAG7091265.1 hypothetical protein E1B28_010315 [Marasmius oreades]
MSGHEFPPINRLGYSLDLLTVTPLDIKAVDQSIKKAFKIFDYDPDEHTREVKTGDETFQVPKTIGVSTDISNFQGSFVTYHSGSEASSKFETDASLSIRYLAVSGGASASYATEKSFRQQNQYAFYAMNADLYSASLRDYINYINEEVLLKRIAKLPRPFDGNHPEHEKKYCDFFASVRTHVINYCTYGARCQMSVWASNTESEVNNHFAASVTASYNGVFARGSFDASVKKESHYKNFTELKQAQVTAQGGDLNLGTYFIMHPDSMDAYDAWGKTTATYPNVTSFSTVEIWSLLRDSASDDLSDAADDLEKAFDHLKDHKEIHDTPVTLSIESDWAEFGLLTPSAVINKPQPSKIPDNTVWSETKIQWGREHSHAYERKDIRFVVSNDGSPIDFYIAHGSQAGPNGRGKVTIITNQGWYENKEITDNNWNTVWFYQKPVNPKVTQTRLSRNCKPCTWNKTLSEYLYEIGHYKKE